MKEFEYFNSPDFVSIGFGKNELFEDTNPACPVNSCSLLYTGSSNSEIAPLGSITSSMLTLNGASAFEIVTRKDFTAGFKHSSIFM